jgi:hypothetical protein
MWSRFWNVPGLPILNLFIPSSLRRLVSGASQWGTAVSIPVRRGRDRVVRFHRGESDSAGHGVAFEESTPLPHSKSPESKHQMTTTLSMISTDTEPFAKSVSHRFSVPYYLVSLSAGYSEIGFLTLLDFRARIFMHLSANTCCTDGDGVIEGTSVTLKPDRQTDVG